MENNTALTSSNIFAIFGKLYQDFVQPEMTDQEKIELLEMNIKFSQNPIEKKLMQNALKQLINGL